MNRATKSPSSHLTVHWHCAECNREGDVAIPNNSPGEKAIGMVVEAHATVPLREKCRRNRLKLITGSKVPGCKAKLYAEIV